MFLPLHSLEFWAPKYNPLLGFQSSRIHLYFRPEPHSAPSRCSASAIPRPEPHFAPSRCSASAIPPVRSKSPQAVHTSSQTPSSNYVKSAQISSQTRCSNLKIDRIYLNVNVLSLIIHFQGKCLILQIFNLESCRCLWEI